MILENSELPHRKVRLAKTKKVNYTQRENMGTDLAILRSTSEDNDGFDYSPLDEVYPLMEKYQADLVHLVVPVATEVCGLANLETYDVFEKECERAENYSLCLENRRISRRKRRKDIFSVSAFSCFGGYVFTHELGHTLGIFHDRSIIDFKIPADMEQGGPFSAYGFGYTSIQQKFCQRTVMAQTSCPAKGISEYRLEPYFSNADLFFPHPTDSPYYNASSFKDIPMGVPGEKRTIDPKGPVNAARAIDDIWDIAASFSDPIQKQCEGGDDIDANALSSLTLAGSESAACTARDPCEVSSGGETLEYEISFSAPDNCLRVRPFASSSNPDLTFSVEKLGRGEFELSITVPPHNSACGARQMKARVDLKDPAYVPGLAWPAYISLEQDSHSGFCKSIPTYPADSVSLDLSGKNLFSLSLPADIFSQFTLLTDLNLSRNHLRDFEGHVLLGNVLTGLDQLEILDLSHNEMVQPSFSNLLHLKRLDLSHNRIASLDAATFSNNTELTHLWLNSNRLSNLPASLFAGLANLQVLNLSGNSLKEMPNLSENGKLKWLNLGDNTIAVLDAEALAHNTKLTHLWLNANRLAELPTDVFSNLEELQLLSLSKNGLDALPDLSDNLALRKLDVSHNKLTAVDEALAEHTELTHLRLNSNRIGMLPQGFFSKLTKLRLLHLGGNQMAALESGAFRNTKLTHLWLNSNGLSALPSKIFTPLRDLAALSLSKNALEEVPDFGKNTKLESLWLYSNQLTALPDNAFAGLSNLRRLWLQSNQIQSISPKAFAGLSRLTYLNLSGNPLKEPLPASVCKFIRGVKKVDMQGIDMKTVCPE